ncbi:MAG: DUF2800 domain-containing protein [Clostridia bacterium]|nr:DUF2800 domain-containing protein [Clostridia bacterium]
MKHEEREHSLLSPSGAHRWLVCTPSARLGEQFPDEPSDEAKEGTRAHEWGAYFLDPDNNDKPEIDADPEMDKCARAYADFVNGLAGDDTLMTEKWIDLTDFVPGCYGYVDAAIIKDNEIHVVDFKYGEGVPVEAKDNPQMMLYALGIFERFPRNDVSMTIFQPRIENVSTFHISGEDLLKWADEVLIPAAQKAWDGEGLYTAGAHCQFCKARSICRQYSIDLVAVKDKDLATITDEELEQWLPYFDDIKKAIKVLEERAFKAAVNGKEWKSMRLVTTQGRMGWKDEDGAVQWLMENGHPELVKKPSPCGIREVEKVMGKGSTERFTGRGEPTTSLKVDKE